MSMIVIEHACAHCKVRVLHLNATSYLVMQGIGYGSPHERQKQYEQYRVHKAAEAVHEYTLKKHASPQDQEQALVTKDKRAAKQIKTKCDLCCLMTII